MANTAAVNGPGKLPVGEYPAIVAWYNRLEQIKAWRDAAAPLPKTP